jgi:hypothetical protein
MSVDKHTLQQWVAGAEVRFKKTRKRFSGVPLVNRVERLAEATQEYVLTEKIDLTKAKDFRAQEAAEDILFASVDLPLLGKKAIGNDTGMAVASLKYVDREGEEHNLIAICAYEISGMVRKTRELKKVIVIPMA